jgi:glucan biosynthesis protein
VPDEFLEYEEDFRTHYDEEYAHEGLRYDEYVPAYHYGATMAREIRYQDKSWDEVEPEVRDDWEREKAVGSWERFKSAVQHGWDRVTGHPHHHR